MLHYHWQSEYVETLRVCEVRAGDRRFTASMALVLKYVDDFHTLMNKTGDPRTADWFLMSSPFYTLGICLTYVYIVKVLGPRVMENRKPFQLKNVLIAYNLFQVIFSAWIFYECLMGGWWGEYNYMCQPVDYSNSLSAIRMTHASWWYYFSKFTEFMDTIFFILRKKFGHVTTLHVIHHGIMPMSVWFGVKFTPGGHSTFFGFLNSFVHIVMYFYYLLAAIGPQMQKYLWWKKYLTTLQMVQFVLIMVHAFQLLFIDCNYPRGFVWFIGMHAVMFFFLFKDFYNQAYNRREKRKLAVQTNGHIKHSEDQNGYLKQNGHTIKQNGHTIKQNGVRDAADYYTNAQFSELNNRTKVE
ncbi:elongation of very long chain fatty acids protein AAEL008004-like isoform X2 [Photinus pyralis]|nr:elongation of very long chain fatty acids protein AAEL008004-like isoform X2 [Photinus pyralis]